MTRTSPTDVHDVKATRIYTRLMKIGVPKELKNHEYRVAITPAGVRELTRHGHEVFVERGAGAGSAIPDEEFEASGACILPIADDVWTPAA